MFIFRAPLKIVFIGGVFIYEGALRALSDEFSLLVLPFLGVPFTQVKGLSSRRLAALLVVVASTLLLAFCSGDSPFRDFGTNTNISGLKDQDGKPFDVKDLRGKVVWVFFGFTTCPEVCPMTLAKLSKAQKLIGFPARNLRTVFISVDPQRDTPKKIKEYLSSFSLKTIGLSGSLTATSNVARNYGVYFKKVPLKNSAAGDYTVNHTSSVFLLDTEGELRYIFHYKEGPKRIASITKMLLPLF